MEVLLDIYKAKSGDKEAFSHIIQKYERTLYAVARARVSNENDVNDVVQETVINMYLNISKLKDISKFNAWMIKILINNCNKYYLNSSKDKNNISYEELSEEHLKDNTIDEMSFNDIISFLDEDEKTIISLYYLNEYTTREISQMLNINESTLRSRISSIRGKIKKTLERGE